MVVAKHQTSFCPLDPYLCAGIVMLLVCSTSMLYSAQNGWSPLIYKQLMHILMAFALLLAVAHLPPRFFYHYAPYGFALICIMLLMVAFTGHIGKGAQRWLSLGFVRFEPSELTKIALPMMLAWLVHQATIPIRGQTLAIAMLCIVVPGFLILKQPDLGTGMIIMACGLALIFLAGLSWRWIAIGSATLAASLPLLWHHMHHYQKERVLTFLNPERDPLGSGYHIIQAKIAIGSGGLWGKGWMQSTQAHLKFLPEHTTDFIFALWSEEFGWMGASALLLVYLSMSIRMIRLSAQMQTPFKQLLCGSLTCLFTLSYVINIGMVCGLLPVVGVPLPLMSYGGSALLMMACIFGMIFSAHHHPTFD